MMDMHGKDSFMFESPRVKYRGTYQNNIKHIYYKFHPDIKRCTPKPKRVISNTCR